MADRRIPGPTAPNPFGADSLDDGTLVRRRSPAPGPVGLQIAQLPLTDRFVEVLRRTAPLLPGEAREQFAQLLTPANLAVLGGTLAAWAGSHYFGVGFVVDAILVAAGAGLLGMQVWAAAADLLTAVRLTAGAATDADLDEAARHMARFVAVAGVTALTALAFKGARRVAPRLRGAVVAAGARYGGLTPAHYRVFKEVARELNRIIAVRSTNPRSTVWIERGFPAKPLEIKIKTSPSTGIVTALGDAEVLVARSKGYYVVDADGVPRNAGGQALHLAARPEWPLEPGQVIHPQQGRPLVGDYDLLGVITPEAPGRNLVLAASNGAVREDWSSPEIRRVAEALNRRLDQPRVMHGAHDGRFDLPDKGGALVFFPDGSVYPLLTPEDVAAFYRTLGRQTITGKY